MRALKAHGTGNDFVVVPDLDGALDLSPAMVRALCDRHRGVGGDGVLRVVRSACDPDGRAMAGAAEFFMDYRNADGSVAEMCGNGARVFMRYLQSAGLAGEHAVIGTRGGVKQVRSHDGVFAVGMGRPELLPGNPVVRVGSGSALAGVPVRMPNPHVVVELADDACLAALELTHAPEVEPMLPGGQNVEFVVRTGPRRLRLRVYERGVGETLSCGTGICAAVAALARADGAGSAGRPWEVSVPGGSCEVEWDGEDVVLIGPAVIVAELELDARWLNAVAGTRQVGRADEPKVVAASCHHGSDD